MESICKYCDKVVIHDNGKQFGAHLTNCKSNPKTIERNKNQVSKKEFKLSCNNCSKEYIIYITDSNYSNGKYKKNCSYKCSNIRIHSDDTKKKVSKTMTKYIDSRNRFSKICKQCNKEFTGRKIQTFCSRSCASTNYNVNNLDKLSKAGRKSVISQNRRSKNEILFADNCLKHFNDVLINESVFNGWDADVIINDNKVAILWNGPWHYKKITKDHSLEQVQNRDKIKVSEIKKCGYIPYIIRDDGKFNVNKVKKEWDVFLNFIKDISTQ